MTPTRERLHRLVDELPEPDVPVAERLLEALADSEDPLLRALAEAPEDDEPVSEEERAAIEEGVEDLRGGRVHSLEEVKRDLGL